MDPNQDVLHYDGHKTNPGMLVSNGFASDPVVTVCNGRDDQLNQGKWKRKRNCCTCDPLSSVLTSACCDGGGQLSKKRRQSLQDVLHYDGHKTNPGMLVSNGFASDPVVTLCNGRDDHLNQVNFALSDVCIISGDGCWNEGLLNGLKTNRPHLRCTSEKDWIGGKSKIDNLIISIERSKCVVIGFTVNPQTDYSTYAAHSVVERMLEAKKLDDARLILVKLAENAEIPSAFLPLNAANASEDNFLPALLKIVDECDAKSTLFEGNVKEIIGSELTKHNMKEEPVAEFYKDWLLNVEEDCDSTVVSNENEIDICIVSADKEWGTEVCKKLRKERSGRSELKVISIHEFVSTSGHARNKTSDAIAIEKFMKYVYTSKKVVIGFGTNDNGYPNLIAGIVFNKMGSENKHFEQLIPVKLSPDAVLAETVKYLEPLDGSLHGDVVKNILKTLDLHHVKLKVSSNNRNSENFATIEDKLNEYVEDFKDRCNPLLIRIKDYFSKKGLTLNGITIGCILLHMSAPDAKTLQCLSNIDMRRELMEALAEFLLPQSLHMEFTQEWSMKIYNEENVEKDLGIPAEILGRDPDELKVVKAAQEEGDQDFDLSRNMEMGNERAGTSLIDSCLGNNFIEMHDVTDAIAITRNCRLDRSEQNTLEEGNVKAIIWRELTKHNMKEELVADFSKDWSVNIEEYRGSTVVSNEYAITDVKLKVSSKNRNSENFETIEDKLKEYVEDFQDRCNPLLIRIKDYFSEKGLTLNGITIGCILLHMSAPDAKTLQCLSDIDMNRDHMEALAKFLLPESLHMEFTREWSMNIYNEENVEKDLEIPAEILDREHDALKLFKAAQEGGDQDCDMSRHTEMGNERATTTTATTTTSLTDSFLGNKFNEKHDVTDAIAITRSCSLDRSEQNTSQEDQQQMSSDEYTSSFAGEIDLKPEKDQVQTAFEADATDVTEPAPVARKPAPVARKPAPVARKPAPVARKEGTMKLHPSLRYGSYTCHLCHSKKDICEKIGVMFRQILNNPSNFLIPCGKLKSEADRQIKQLELIHDLQPKLREVTEKVGKLFQNWSRCRLETIEELTKFIGQVAKVKTCTNVVKACGQAGGIIGSIISIGGVILAPDSGGLSLTALGIRISLPSAVLKIGAQSVDGVFANLVSKRVASLIKRDRELTEQMTYAVESMISASEVFIQAVDEFQRRNQSFDFQAFTTGVQELKTEKDQVQTALEALAIAMKTGVKISQSAGHPGLTGFLIGIDVLFEVLEFIKTVKDLKDGSKSQLQEEIMALTAVLIREHDILKKQYDSYQHTD